MVSIVQVKQKHPAQSRPNLWYHQLWHLYYLCEILRLLW